jgi:hypothetical protein
MDGRRSIKYRPFLLFAFLGLFAAGLSAPTPAAAQCCGTPQPVILTSDTSVDAIVNWVKQLLLMLQQISATSGVGGATAASAGVATGAAANMAQFQGDNVRYNTQVDNASKGAEVSTLPPGFTACAVGNYAATHMQAEGALGAMSRAVDTQGAGANKGVGAGNSSVLAAEEVQDLCKLGFINPNDYGTLATQLGCSTSQPQYYNTDESLSSLLGQLQYPVPSGAYQAADGTLFFAITPSGSGGKSLGTGPSSSPQPAAANGAAGAMDFIAAWKFCHHLPKRWPTPAFGSGSRTPSPSDLQSIFEDRNVTAEMNGPQGECLHSLLYRTACSSTSQAVFQAVSGSTQNCNQMQYNLCVALSNDPIAGITMQPPPGVNAPPAATIANSTVGTGGGVVSGYGIQDNAYIQNCLNNGAGLSFAMADYILANRCASATYMRKVLPAVINNTEELEKFVQYNCQMLHDNFQAQLDLERQQVLGALEALAQTKDTGASAYNPSARPTQQSQ